MITNDMQIAAMAVDLRRGHRARLVGLGLALGSCAGFQVDLGITVAVAALGVSWIVSDGMTRVIGGMVVLGVNINATNRLLEKTPQHEEARY